MFIKAAAEIITAAHPDPESTNWSFQPAQFTRGQLLNKFVDLRCCAPHATPAAETFTMEATVHQEA